MRKREFRPTLDGRLEDRIVPAGHPVVRFTTTAYSNALSDIDLSVDTFLASERDLDAKAALVRSLQGAAKTIPYGGKALFPVLIRTVSTLENAEQMNGLKGSLNNVVKEYIRQNVEKGFIRYLQSNVRHVTDGDIPTSRRVGKGSKK